MRGMFTDTRQQFVLNVENSALTYVKGRQSSNADATVALARDAFEAVTLQRTTFADAVKAGLIKVDGDPRKLEDFLSMR